MRAKLPKLEVRHFNTKVDEWQEFWDGYESSIHSNPNLSDVDKFFVSAWSSRSSSENNNRRTGAYSSQLQSGH